MAMNAVIREKRKELGLTQEKVAEYLGVSAPAVNKWEKGITCPDISLLPPLARLLKTDLNTLLCFHEELTKQEIAAFSLEAVEAVRTGGMEGGLMLVREKIREYPGCGELLLNAAMIMDGSWFIKGACSRERERYAEEIVSLYEQAAECGDEKVRASARYMLASKYMGRGEYEKAQQMVELLPERSGLNKCQMQANLYIGQDRLQEAACLMERSLITALNELQGILICLADIAVREGRTEEAAAMGESWRTVAKEMGLWDYNGLVIALQAALDSQNEEQSVRLLKEMVTAVMEPWNIKESPLYRHIPLNGNPADYGKQILPSLIYELESSPKYGFLSENEEFRELMKRYRLMARQGENGP